MTSDSLAEFENFFPVIQEYIGRFLPKDWPEASIWSASLIIHPGPVVLLPLASCAAVGESPEEAVPLAAAWKVYGLAMRLLDDLQDQDRPGSLWDQVGPARTFNFGAFLYATCQEMLATANWPAERHRQISKLLAKTGKQLLRGQDRDLKGMIINIEDYWQMMVDKNAAAFAFICQAGAMCGTEIESEIEHCFEYGHHLGMAIQLLDDFQGFWVPEGAGDVAMNKLTLPILVALEHPSNREGELAEIVAQRLMSQNVERVLKLVEQSDARAFMLLSATGARDRALAALDGLPASSGSMVLGDYVRSLFLGLEEYLD